MMAEQMKKDMVLEIESMTDNNRLEDEYNHFFGNEDDDYVCVDQD